MKKEKCARCLVPLIEKGRGKNRSSVAVIWAGKTRSLCNACGDLCFDWQYKHDGKTRHPMLDSKMNFQKSDEPEDFEFAWRNARTGERHAVFNEGGLKRTKVLIDGRIIHWRRLEPPMPLPSI